VRDLRFFFFLAVFELSSSTDNVLELLATARKPVFSEFTDDAMGQLGTVLIDMSIIPTKLAVCIDPATALPPSSPGQPRTNIARRDRKALTTEANMVIIASYGLGESYGSVPRDIGGYIVWAG
jgi:hypothetical protein